jgi:hypothetical protein
MEAILVLVKAHQTYIWIGAAALAVIVVGLAFLNRPSREEKAHEKRFQGLKDKGKDQYRTLRPLK